MVHEEHFEQPTEIGSEMTQSQVVPPNIHEAETVHTASHLPIQPVLQDQILVADLTHHHEKAMDPVEMASQKVVRETVDDRIDFSGRANARSDTD